MEARNSLRAQRSPELDAWLVVVNEGHTLRLADDEAATSFWMTAEESAIAQKNSALARVAELEAKLAGRG